MHGCFSEIKLLLLLFFLIIFQENLIDKSQIKLILSGLIERFLDHDLIILKGNLKLIYLTLLLHALYIFLKPNHKMGVF